MKERRKAYEEKLDVQLEEWNAQIDLLKAKADKAKAVVKIEFYKNIGALQHKQEGAGTKLHELKTAEDEALGNVKTGSDKAWDEVKTAYHSAAFKCRDAQDSSV